MTCSVKGMIQRGIIDYQCKKWDEISSSVDFSLSVDVDRVKELLPFKARLLDYGCGYGRISRMLKNAGYVNIIGYDTSFGMIERGQIQNSDLDLRLTGSYALPEPSGSFDAVIIAGVFTSLPEQSLRELVMEEINRVLKQNGVLVLSEFLRDDQKHYDDYGCFFSKLGIRMKHFHEAEIHSMLNGWEIIHFESVKAESISRSIMPAVHVAARIARCRINTQPTRN